MGSFRSLDLQLFAGLGVAAHACGALRHFECAEADHVRESPFFQGAQDDVDQRADCTFGIRLA